MRAELRFDRAEHLRAQRFDQPGDAVAADPILAGHHHAHRLHQHLRRRFLQHQAARPELQRLDDVVAIDARGQEDGPRRQRAAAERAQDFEPRQSGHREIQQQNARLGAARHFERLVSVERLADDEDVALGLEQLAQPLEQDRVIVGDYDLNRLIHG